jgi:hypothetical protein
LHALPPSFLFRDREPAYRGIQEILWSLWLEVTDECLGGPAPPQEVRVGRELAPLPVSTSDWDAFHAELGLQDAETRAHVGLLLGLQMTRHPDLPIRPVARPMPLHLLGLVLITCHLESRSRVPPLTDYSYDASSLFDTVRRHPAPTAFGPFNQAEVASAVEEYAGLRCNRPEFALKSAYHVVVRSLRKRMEGRNWTPPPIAPLTLTKGVLIKALEGLTTETPPRMAESPIEPAPPDVDKEVMEEPSAYSESPALSPLEVAELASVLEPLLQSPSEPLSLVHGEDPRLAQKLCQAAARYLRRTQVEWFGCPGQTVKLALPHAHWQLDDRVLVERVPETACRYRISRWGLKVSGHVLLPALVIPMEEVSS